MISRRAFLAGAGGLAGLGALGGLGTLGLGRLVRLAHAEPLRAPTRLLVLYKPNGTVPAAYDCTGTGSDFTLSPILEPFAELRDRMVVVDGLDIWKKPNTPGEDHGNAIVTFMTGGITYRPDPAGFPLAERASIDYLLSRDPRITGDAPIRSLHLAADTRSAALFTRTLSYAGRGAAIAAEPRPHAAYARVFGSLADPTLDVAELRARKQSVLDFATADLARVSRHLAGPERARLDFHLTAIRELELLLDRSLDCTHDVRTLGRGIGGLDPDRPDDHHAELGRAQLEIVRAAFRCDLSRIATFAWASGHSYVNFGRLVPGVQHIGYHSLTHEGSNQVHDETAVHRWYNERMADLVRALRDTPDLDGRSLLDNTLVVVWSEVRLGIHTFDSVPIQLFGGAGGRLAGGRRLAFPNRPTNDLWLAIANALGHELTVFGDAERCTGPLPGLFA